VASDALDRSDQLVEFGIDLAQARHASLVLMHAARAESGFRPTRISAQIKRVSQDLGESSIVRVEPGRAHAAILKTAEQEGASLVLLSSRRKRGLRALGSVSERVVHDAPCSVLVVRPEDL
jgi:nucleotide-binding universal stress UspA family protein